MAIFSRREIQCRLDEAAKFLTHAQLTQLVLRLNKVDSSAIDAEWELMCLTNLSRIGRLQHEPELPNTTRRPDIYFQSNKVNFIADIAAVTDDGYQKENPVRHLRSEMHRLYKKHSIRGGFSLNYQSQLEGQPGDQRVKLQIPSRREVQSFVSKNFEPFIKSVGQNPDKPAIHKALVNEGAYIQLDYDPKRRPHNHESGHLSFDVPYSLTRNPIYNSLKNKKKQLANCSFGAIVGIILCDGGCSTLCRKGPSGSAYSLDNIIRNFLRQNSSIAFVLTIGVESRHEILSTKSTRLSFDPKFYTQQNLNPEHRQNLIDIFNAMLQQFPKLHRTPLNARYRLDAGSPPPVRVSDYFCWFKISLGGPMQNVEIKLSARTLASLLAGEIDLKEFREAHRMSFNNGTKHIEPLRRMVEEGRTIESVVLEKMPGEDDDLVVLRFGPIDPAAAKFQIPETDKKAPPGGGAD